MIEKDKKVTIHLVSDSTGETVSRAFDAVISQFPRTEKCLPRKGPRSLYFGKQYTFNDCHRQVECL